MQNDSVFYHLRARAKETKRVEEWSKQNHKTSALVSLSSLTHSECFFIFPEKTSSKTKQRERKNELAIVMHFNALAGTCWMVSVYGILRSVCVCNHLLNNASRLAFRTGTCGENKKTHTQPHHSHSTEETKKRTITTTEKTHTTHGRKKIEITIIISMSTCLYLECTVFVSVCARSTRAFALTRSLLLFRYFPAR